MRQIIFLFMSLIAAKETMSYRFVCNGILADGSERADSCGPCTEESAARWANPNVPVVVDYSVLPPGISDQDWRHIVKSSLDAWNQVSNTSFRFIELDAPSYRDFGLNDLFHEIFWITDLEEWRRLVGTGEFGTLGATLPRYSCNMEDNKRVIGDSDLVLNGLSHNLWKRDCDSDDCMDPQTTLVHELGHFLGLDHPCLKCDTSIMSARAGYNLKYPLYDDMAGLRVLYPDNTYGGFGFPCLNDGDCSKDHFCINDKKNKYCSTKCLSENDCEFGAACTMKDEQSFCTFVDGGYKRLQQNCSRVPCEEPLVCVGKEVERSYCFAPCHERFDCGLGQNCMRLSDDDISICITIKHKGEICTDTELCDPGMFCVFDGLDQGICRQSCGQVNVDTTGCSYDEHCELVEGEEICVPDTELLVLDNSSDSFRGNDRQKSDDSLFGCSTNTMGANIYLLFFALLLLAFKQFRTFAIVPSFAKSKKGG